MTMRPLARSVATLGNVLAAASLFFVLIWWRVSVYLFAAGAVAYLLAWLLDGEVPSWPSTVRE